MNRNLIKSLTVGTLALSAFVAQAETYAVCMGINKYPAPVDDKGNPFKDEKGNPVSCNLNGAVNDANSMRDMLVGKFKVKGENCHVVTDAAANIDGFVKELKWMVQTAQAGDQIVFTFSGHGSQLPDKTKPNGKASVIVLADDQLIPSDFFKKLSTTLKGAGINCTFVFDSCFSGGMSRNAISFDGTKVKTVKSRALVIPKGTSGTPIAANGPMPLSARAKFNTEAALLTKSGVKSKAKSAGAIRGEVAYLFASEDMQTSSDLDFNDPAKKPRGLFSLMLELILNNDPTSPVGEVVNAITDFIKNKTDFKQRPGTEFSNEERSKRPLVFEN